MTDNRPTVALAQALIQRPSVTPEDEGCQQLMAERLEALGFKLEWMQHEEVLNLWARRGEQGPLFAFAGHTDVVPTGPESKWQHPPFAAHIEGDTLHGRGAADMKGSLAAMVTAVEAFVEAHPDHDGSIAFLITSDEEGPAKNGTVKVVETLMARDELIDYCLVGEPSSTVSLGDVVKNGRRGSMNADIVIHGKQGHVAYPHLARNPIHLATPALTELSNTVWDEGNEYFPATTFQISNVHAGEGKDNVVPGELDVQINFRFCTESSAESLQQRTEAILKQHELDYEVNWRISGYPFLTPKGALTAATTHAVQKITGHTSQLSTTGGTSDGRFIARMKGEIVELGPINATIHQVNECVSCQDLENLSKVYCEILKQLLVPTEPV